MKILSIQAKNFASYKQLDFEFNDQGLCLIEGPTGSGKSTLCDLIPWVLFGKTAKDGNADDIRPWNTDEPTEAIIRLRTNNYSVSIHRARAKGSNDLYYKYQELDNYDPRDHEIYRGKDLNDTQKQINELLGMTYETYMTSAYYHEFSNTANFFNTTAKTRREITEQLVDLSLAKRLTKETQERKTAFKNQVTKLEKDLASKQVAIKVTNDQLNSLVNLEKNYVNDTALKLVNLMHRKDNFDQDKQKALDSMAAKMLAWEQAKEKELKDAEKHDLCHNCGVKSIAAQNHIKTLEAKINPYLSQYEREEQKENTIDLEIEALKNAKNPYTSELIKQGLKLKSYQKELGEIEAEFNAAKQNLTDLDIMSDIVDAFRASLISSTVSFLESNTNSILSTYFDGDLKITLDVSSADKIEVNIFKDGNECKFTQMSKGQRAILKLAFGVSVMKQTATTSNVKPNCIFFDEALTGLDSNLKAKAFKLFEQLSTEYASVFVVEHNENFKSLFSKTFSVQLINGESVVEET